MSAATRKTRGGGFAAIQAVFLVLIFAAVAVAHYWSATTGLHQSRNQAHIQTSTLEAESGMEFLVHLLGQRTVPGDVSGPEFLDAVYQNLSAQLDGTDTLDGASVQYTGDVIMIPSIAAGQPDRRFSASLVLDGEEGVVVTVTGRCGQVTRSIRMDFVPVRQSHPMFKYGIAAQGPISFQNTVSISGANEAWEADLFSAWPGTAFRLEDNLSLDGDVYAGAPGADVLVSGDGTIAGDSMSSPEVMDHVHVGVGDAEFPQIDITPFTPFATNTVNNGTDTSGGTFENIRIKSGTNPTFSGGARLNGVIYVESPNQVTFASDTVITGIIVTDDGEPATDMLRFENNTEFHGLEDLPETEQWADLRELAGSFMLAPGFRVKFENESGALSGFMAAEHFKFENAFVGDIAGGIFSYGTDEIKAEDGSSFTIDRCGFGSQAPIGFVVPKLLCPAPSTYEEL
ncbi:MAG: hypothetical protein ACP5HU_01880 [Phycisphaerae bacterium]